MVAVDFFGLSDETETLIVINLVDCRVENALRLFGNNGKNPAAVQASTQPGAIQKSML